MLRGTSRPRRTPGALAALGGQPLPQPGVVLHAAQRAGQLAGAPRAGRRRRRPPRRCAFAPLSPAPRRPSPRATSGRSPRGRRVHQRQRAEEQPAQLAPAAASARPRAGGPGAPGGLAGQHELQRVAAPLGVAHAASRPDVLAGLVGAHVEECRRSRRGRRRQVLAGPVVGYDERSRGRRAARRRRRQCPRDTHTTASAARTAARCSRRASARQTGSNRSGKRSNATSWTVTPWAQRASRARHRERMVQHVRARAARGPGEADPSPKRSPGGVGRAPQRIAPPARAARAAAAGADAPRRPRPGRARAERAPAAPCRPRCQCALAPRSWCRSRPAPVRRLAVRPPPAA